MYVVEQLDKDRIQEFSTMLAEPTNLNIYLRSKTFTPEEHCPIEDPWYFTKYGKEQFSESLLSLMSKPNVERTQ